MARGKKRPRVVCEDFDEEEILDDPDSEDSEPESIAATSDNVDPLADLVLDDNDNNDEQAAGADQEGEVAGGGHHQTANNLPIGQYIPGVTRENVKKRCLLFALNYFTKLDSGEEATCNICNAGVRGAGGKRKYTEIFSIPNGATTSLWTHFRVDHKKESLEVDKEKKEVERVNEKNSKKGKSSDGTKQMTLSMGDNNNLVCGVGKKTPWSSREQKRWDNAVVEVCSETMISFRATEKFDKLTEALGSSVKVRTHKTVARHTSLKAKELLNETASILKFLKSQGCLNSVGLTSDLWTDEFRRSYMNLSVHAITPDFNLLKLNPICAHFPEQHTGDNLKQRFDEFMEILGLNDPSIQIWLTLDNAKNNIKLQRLLSNVTELWCIIHTTQLSVKDLFESIVGDVDIKSLLDKTQLLADKTKNNAAVQRALEASCKATNSKKYVIPLANDTRWNSKDTQLVAVEKMKEPLEHMLFRDRVGEFRDILPTPEEHDAIHGLIATLNPLLIATKKWEADKEATLSRAIPELFNVRGQLVEVLNGKDDSASMFAGRLIDMLDSRVPDCGTRNEHYRVAHLLDPSYKGVVMKQRGYSGYETAREDVLRLCETYSPPSTTVAVASDQSNRVQDLETEDLSGLTPVEKIMRQQEMSRARETESEPQAPVLSKAEMEMRDYESMKVAKDVDALKFWWNNRGRFPILSKVASDHLRIPVSSAASERAFSVGGQAVTKRRSRLKPERVEELIRLKMNTKIVKEFKSKYKLGPNVSGAVQLGDVENSEEEDYEEEIILEN